MKKSLIIFAVILVVLLVLSGLKNQIVKSTIAAGVATVTGAPAHIDSVSLGILKQSIDIKGFKLYNPKGFPNEILLDIPTIKINYDLGALLQKKLHMKTVEVDLKEMGVIKNKEGKLNVDSLKVVEQQKEAQPKEKKTQEMMPMQIDELVLSIGKVVSRDYTVGPQGSVQVFDVGIKRKTYKNITTAQQLISLILIESMKPTAIKSAKVYALNTIMGVGFLPAGVALTLAGKDYTQQDFDSSFEKVYDASLSIAQKMGKVTQENKEGGMIKALVNKNDVTIKIKKLTEKSTQLTVSARRLLLPKPDVAGGVLLEISERLK